MVQPVFTLLEEPLGCEMYTVCSCPCARVKYLKEEMFSVIFQESLNKIYQYEWLKFELLKINMFLL